jgi:hypothetical protein
MAAWFLQMLWKFEILPLFQAENIAINAAQTHQNPRQEREV